MTQNTIKQQIQEQIAALKIATDKAVQSKETAIKYLQDAGIINKDEKAEPVKTQNR